jgi:hypothetical protein
MRRKLLVAAVSLATLCLIGYASAHFRTEDCGRAVIDTLSSRSTAAAEIGRTELAVGDFLVLVRVRAPFIVGTHVDLPNDRHGNSYSATYLTMPWGIYKVSSQRTWRL